MVRHLSFAELRENGLLQEINRQLLHPLGLALEAEPARIVGDPVICRILDHRHDPEGMIFAVPATELRSRARQFSRLWKRRTVPRRKALGFVVQPVQRKKAKES
jgi:hypothetical protein